MLFGRPLHMTSVEPTRIYDAIRTSVCCDAGRVPRLRYTAEDAGAQIQALG